MIYDVALTVSHRPSTNKYTYTRVHSARAHIDGKIRITEQMVSMDCVYVCVCVLECALKV